MARLWSSGFELDDPLNGSGNSIGAEWFFDGTSGSDPGVTMVTSPVHSGSHSCEISVPSTVSNSGLFYCFYGNSSNSNGPFWARFYLNINANPNVSNSIFEMDAYNGVTGSYIRLNTNGSLSLMNASNAQIGSTSSILNLNTWYRVEIHMDMTGGSGANVLEAALNGAIFATTSTSTQTQEVASIFFGSNLESEGATSGVWYFDDIAINDSTGSYQTGYPGPGNIFILIPSGAGDSTQWTIGGSSPAATNWQSVNTIPPYNSADDTSGTSTNLVYESIANKSDLYTVGTSPMGVSDTVSVVHVGGRFNNDSPDATTAFQFQIEKTSGGTITKSSSLTPNSSVWVTNTPGIQSTQQKYWPYPITLYMDPDGLNWTEATINSIQIGMLAGTVGTHKIQVSNVWALVEYIPSTGPTAFFEFFAH